MEQVERAADYLSKLDPDHRARLDWFAARTGEVIGWPKPMPNGDLLVSKAKAIYKPELLDYALSVRIMIDSPYRDGEILRRSDGSWCLAYHQENADPLDRDYEYTNVGLLRCIEDKVPVAVLRQVRPTSSLGSTRS
jgi:hypothetical protein